MTLDRLHRSDAALWFAIAIAVLASVMFGHLPGTGRWATELNDFAHGPAFAVVTIALISYSWQGPNRPESVLRAYVAAMTAAVLLGAIIELLQLATGRDASLSDLGKDALGVLAAAGVLMFFDPRVRTQPRGRIIRGTGLLIAVVSAAALIAPLALTSAAYLHRNRIFPTLVDFSSPVGAYFVVPYGTVTIDRAPLPLGLVGESASAVALRAQLDGTLPQWGLALWEPSADWSGYNRLAVDLANPGDASLVLRMKIRDGTQVNDRRAGYLGTIELLPNSRTIHRVPLSDLAMASGRARVDTTMVHSIVLTGDPENRARSFDLVRIWLE